MFEKSKKEDSASLISRMASLQAAHDKLQRANDKLNKSHDELAERVKALELALCGEEASVVARMILFAAEKRLLDLLCLAAGHDREDYRRIDDVLSDIEESTASPAVTKAWDSFKNYWPKREMRGLMRDLSHSCVCLVLKEDLDFYRTLSKKQVMEVLHKATLTSLGHSSPIPDDLINVVVELHTLTAITADSSEKDDVHSKQNVI